MHHMNDSNGPSQEQAVYWQEFTQLKLDTCYVRDYRDSIARWETVAAAIRAVTSSSSIAAWVIWRKYAFIWAALIAASQVADALRDVFPFRKRRQALSGWSNALNRLFVDAQRDWDNISAGSISNTKIAACTHQLRQKIQRYEETYVPDGLVRKQTIFEAAQKEMETFFRTRYPIDEEKY
jgi:hypothetical protein